MSCTRLYVGSTERHCTIYQPCLPVPANTPRRRPIHMGLTWQEEANVLAAPAQLQREGAHRDPKLGVQGDSEWGLSTNRSVSSISYKMAENINIDCSRRVAHNTKL